MSTTRLVVIGADAAGMSGAHQALRTARTNGRDLAVVVLDAGHDTSFSACGIPYWVAGDVGSRQSLVARTPAEHRAAGIDLRLGTTVTELDLGAGHVVTDAGERIGFDEVLLATGAEPLVPDWARASDGQLVPGVLLARRLDDGEAWRRVIAEGVPGRDGRRHVPRRAVVVGGGYIGIEMAEALLRRGLEVALVTRGELMGSLDADMGARLTESVRASGVEVVCGHYVDGLDVAADGRVTCVMSGSRRIPADVVAVATGVRPRSELAKAAGLPLGTAGGLLPDASQRIGNGVWAAGDCVESLTRLHGQRTHVPLGTHANKQGRVAGTNIGGGTATFGGVLGTAVTRFVAGGVEVEVGRTGPTSDQLAADGIGFGALVTESTTASGYMPEASPVAVKVIAETGGERPGRLVGVQIVGGRGSAKRIDTAAAAMWLGAHVADVAEADLSYAPPLSPTWDPVQIACRRLAERI